VSSLKELMAADRRLVILRLLANEDVHGSATDSVLQTALDHVGHAVSRDQVRTDMAWLGEQQLVDVEELAEDIHVATLTRRGGDVAAGRATVPGVKRPSPAG
jgi:hypothetical protein